MSDDIAPSSMGFWAKCDGCSYCWIVGFYPAPAAQWAKTALANSRLCPKCGGKKIYVAKQAGGVLLEPTAP